VLIAPAMVMNMAHPLEMADVTFLASSRAAALK